MDHQFTEKLQQWMNTPDNQKDWDEGAIMLLQLSGNKIMYHNIAVNPKGKAEFIKGKLQKYLDFRLQQLTHEQVADMQRQVDAIVANHPIVAKPITDGTQATAKTEAEEWKAGKRADHDQLPDEIKALYIENLDIVRQMRELHLRLRLLNTQDATCPDSERYPFLKELIILDKRLHDNWNTYDHYVAASTPVAECSVSSDTIAAPAATTEEAKAETAPKKTAKRTTRKYTAEK